jgi:hypothetical protein
MMEESIYNIIPKEYHPEPKRPIYRSKYPPTIPPTGSTFCHVTTSKPGVKILLARLPIYQVSSHLVCKLTLKKVMPLQWDTSSMIGNHLLIISGRKIQEQWEVVSYLLSVILVMTVLTRNQVFQKETKSLLWA